MGGYEAVFVRFASRADLFLPALLGSVLAGYYV